MRKGEGGTIGKEGSRAREVAKTGQVGRQAGRQAGTHGGETRVTVTVKASRSREVKVRTSSVCTSFGASPSAIVFDMEAYQNGRDRADVFVSV